MLLIILTTIVYKYYLLCVIYKCLYSILKVTWYKNKPPLNIN